MTGTFTFAGGILPYADADYNHTRLNERAVEVPIAQAFTVVNAALDRAGLEVGNVLSHYGPAPSRRIVDLYEGPERLDLFDIEHRYDWIVCISTLEHVRWDVCPLTKRHPDGSGEALDHLLSLLAPGGSLLVTVPFGWQPFFDSQILSDRWAPAFACSMVRAPHSNRAWLQASVHHRRYAASSPWAESVWIAEFKA